MTQLNYQRQIAVYKTQLWKLNIQQHEPYQYNKKGKGIMKANNCQKHLIENKKKLETRNPTITDRVFVWAGKVNLLLYKFQSFC